MDDAQRALVMLVVATVCGGFVSLNFDYMGDKLAVSYTLDKASGCAKICVNVWPQTLYFWEAGDPLNLKVLNYYKFSAPGEAVFKINLAFLSWKGVVNLAADLST